MVLNNKNLSIVELPYLIYRRSMFLCDQVIYNFIEKSRESMRRSLAVGCVASILLMTPLNGACVPNEMLFAEREWNPSEPIGKIKEVLAQGNFTNETYLLLLAACALAAMGGAGSVGLFLKHAISTGKMVFIVSRGYERKKFDDITSPKIRYFKPIVTWHYTKSKLLFKPSRTLIIDPSLAKIKILSGKQAGILLGFAGFYIHVSRASAFTREGFTYFVGFAYMVVAIDLPDLPLP